MSANCTAGLVVSYCRRWIYHSALHNALVLLLLLLLLLLQRCIAVIFHLYITTLMYENVQHHVLHI